MSLLVPMSSPELTREDIQAVHEVLETNWLSIGPKVEQFEHNFADYVGTRYATSVNSGTSGLHLTTIAANIQPGDEVITSSFSFVASANCILYERAKPVFIDIDPHTNNMDPTLIEAAITDRTKAILVVHAFGQPADMDPILEIARKYNLYVIEDACEALGAHYKGRAVGTLADSAVFAFYPNKQITTGEGGMIVTDREDWQQIFRSLRNQGRDVFDAWLNHTRLGYNYRLDEMSAALGLSQLKRIDTIMQKRAQVAAWYSERLTELPAVETPQIAETTTQMSWFIYVIRCGDGINRNKLMTVLQEEGIPSRPYFMPIHLQPFYMQSFGWKRGDFPHTEYAGEVSLAIPFSTVMTESQVELVCAKLSKCINTRWLDICEDVVYSVRP